MGSIWVGGIRCRYVPLVMFDDVDERSYLLRRGGLTTGSVGMAGYWLDQHDPMAESNVFWAWRDGGAPETLAS